MVELGRCCLRQVGLFDSAGVEGFELGGHKKSLVVVVAVVTSVVALKRCL